MWRGLHRWVLRPVDALAGQTRDVASGDLNRLIVPAGPPEFVRLGSDVETMRRRIADELGRAEAAREELVERSAELARSNDDLEQFAYVASHDLSEPLRKVANFCQLLERQYGPQLDDKARQYIDFAVDGAKRMQALINDLLAFSRVGRTTEAFGYVDTTAVMERANVELADQISAAGAEIHYDGLPTVWGDQTLLTGGVREPGRQLGEVPRHRPARGQSQRRTPPEGWLFTVADNGIGIDPAVRRADLRDLPAAAPARRVRRYRHRAGAVPQDRRVPRRPDLARPGQRHAGVLPSALPSRKGPLVTVDDRSEPNARRACSSRTTRVTS